MCRNQTHFFSFSAYFLSANTLSEKTMTLSLRLKKKQNKQQLIENNNNFAEKNNFSHDKAAFFNGLILPFMKTNQKLQKKERNVSQC